MIKFVNIVFKAATVVMFHLLENVEKSVSMMGKNIRNTFLKI